MKVYRFGIRPLPYLFKPPCLIQEKRRNYCNRLFNWYFDDEIKKLRYSIRRRPLDDLLWAKKMIEGVTYMKPLHQAHQRYIKKVLNDVIIWITNEINRRNDKA